MWILFACTAEPIRLQGEAPVETVSGPCARREHPPVVISELVPGNVDGQLDQDGSTSDWVEIQNRGEREISLAGWTLEEDDDVWEFPSRRLGPGELLPVFASGKDGRPGFVATAELHTSFSLGSSFGSTDGALLLTAPDGCVVDEARWTDAPADVSYGRPDHAPEQWAWFLEPTFGLPNTSPSRPGFATRAQIDVPAGIFRGLVTVSAEERGEILRYTLDGSDPTEASPVASAPLRIDPANAPVILRVRSFAEGRWPGPIVTRTWLAPEIFGPDLTVVSLVSDPDGLFSDTRGIWAYGESYERNYPYFDANFWEDWERPVSVEVFPPSGELGLSQDAGVRIHGGYSRAFDQRGLRLLARSAYGDDTFDYPFFAREDLGQFHTLVLHNGGDWCSTHLFDASSDLLLRDLEMGRYPGVDSQAWTPVMVYLNGVFWGMYQLRERMDEWWIADHHGADPDNLDQVELGWTHSPHWELEQGDWEAFDRLNEDVARQDLADPDAWENFEAQVDVQNLASLAALEAWYGNADFWGNNLRLWRDRDGGRWRWMLYDLGHGWPSASYDQLGTSVTYVGEGMPLGAAFDNPRFREIFATTLADYLNTSLSAAVAVARLDDMAARVRPGMQAQLDRWCGGTPLSSWDSTMAYAREYTAQRGLQLRGQARDHLGLGDDVNLTLTADPPDAGRFQLTATSVPAPFTGIYYAGVPMTVTAVPNPGYQFESWVGQDNTDPTLTLDMRADTARIARFTVQ